MSDFYDWLVDQMKRRGWGTRELARNANLPHTSISRLSHGNTQAGPKVCRGVAAALGMPAVLVFEQAGLLPRRPPDVHDTELLKHIYYGLDAQKRKQLVEYAEFLRGGMNT